MTRTWGVTLPIAGTAYIEIDADTEEEAIEEALNNVSREHLESWDAYRQLVRGNVISFGQNEIEAQDLGEAE